MMREARPAVLLFAHGARDPAWAGPFQAVVRELQRLAPGLPVRLAFLEFMAPDMDSAAAELVASGATGVVVMPLFLGAGGHVRRDVPPLLERLRERYPAVEWHLEASIGESERVIDAMARGTLDRLRALVGGDARAAPADNGAPTPAETRDAKS